MGSCASLGRFDHVEWADDASREMRRSF